MSAPNTEKPSSLVFPVIEISNGYQRYGLCSQWRLVLKNFNLVMNRGEMYVLLGPSGCGKTTVIQVIIGTVKLNEGTIKIFGASSGMRNRKLIAGRVGYFPQNRGLFEFLTIKETLRFYGKLLRLEGDYIDKRIAFLGDLLALPLDNRQIRCCALNLQRRISIGVALLHEPELLILDNPTFGIEPGLRRSIWKHLHHLAVEEKVSVFVTTTNCLDATEATRLGIMKNGTLLLEESPRLVLSSLHINSMETLYTKVYSSTYNCTREEKLFPLVLKKDTPPEAEDVHSEGFMFTETANVQVPKKRITVAMVASKCCKSISLYLPECDRFLVLMHCKLLSLRFPLYLILFLVLPSVFLALFVFTNGNVPRAVLGVVNKEVLPGDCDEFSEYISCHILNLVNYQNLTLQDFDNKADAIDAVVHMKAAGVLVVGMNFSRRIEEDVKKSLGLSEEQLTYSMVLYLDESNRIVADDIIKHIMDAITKYREDIDFKSLHDFAPYPFQVGPPVYGNNGGVYSHYSAPNLVMVISYHMAAFFIAYTIVESMTNQQYHRITLTGTRQGDITFVDILSYGCLVLLQTTLMFVVITCVDKVPMVGQFVYLFPSILVQILCGLCCGRLLSIFFENSTSVACCVLVLFIKSLLLEAVLWPVEGQSSWLRPIVKLLPQYRAMTTVRSIMLKGTSLKLSVEWLGIVIPACWLVMFLICFNVLSK